MSHSDVFLCISRSMHIIYLLTTANTSISDEIYLFIWLYATYHYFFFFFSWQFEEIYYPSVHSLDECCIVSNGKSFSVIQGILPSLIFSNQFKRFMFRLGWNMEAYDFWSNHKNTNTCIFSSVSMQYFLVTEEMRTLCET